MGGHVQQPAAWQCTPCTGTPGDPSHLLLLSEASQLLDRWRQLRLALLDGRSHLLCCDAALPIVPQVCCGCPA